MFENLEIWWVTGAQLLYGGDAVVAVDGHSKEMVDGLNKSALKKGDIRTLKTINIPSKNAKILGEVPETSYTMTQGESASRLDITNPTRFWSSNNRVLVIQVK